jgi:hypothetical protein
VPHARKSVRGPKKMGAAPQSLFSNLQPNPYPQPGCFIGLRVEVCALIALCAVCVEVCALSALCAIRVGFGGVRAGFRVLCFGPKTCGPSSPGGGSPVDKAEAHSLFAYVAMKKTPDLNSA